MAYIGDKGRSEVIRLRLDLYAGATGTPTITITRGQGTALDTPISAVNMTMGADSSVWYYDYTTEASAQVGLYTAEYSAVISGVTRLAHDFWDVTIKDADDLSSEISAITGGSGTASVIVSIKDGAAADVEGVKVTVHNAANSDTVVAGPFTTDSSGDTSTFNVNDDTYTVRMYKAGAVSENSSIVVSGSATHEIVVTVTSISNPSDPEICRLFLFPITLDNQEITTLTINISSKDRLTKVNEQYITNATSTFTLDATTDPNNFYFDAVRGSEVKIWSKNLGIDHETTVPDQVTKDLSDLIS